MKIAKLPLAALTLLALAGCATAPAGERRPGVARAPAATPKAPAAPVFLADDIEGKLGRELDALLGSAALTRIEGAGEYRRYALAECSLIVILYPDETGKKRAAHLDAAALRAGDEKPDLDACLAEGKG